MWRASRRQHRQCACKQVPPTQNPSELMVLLDAISRAVDRGQHAAFEVVVPGEVPELRWNVAPGNHEHGVALFDRVPDEGIFRPQVENVVLVDARRDDQQRTLEHGRRRRRVLISSISLVLKDDAARCHRQIASYLECRLVGHRDPAPLRVGDQIRCALGDRCALRRKRELQGVGIGRQKIRRCNRADVLVGDERQPFFGVRIGLRQIGQLAHVVGVEQVGILDERKVRLLAPSLCREPSIAIRLDGGGHTVCAEDARPERFEFLLIARVDRGKRLGWDPGHGHGRESERLGNGSRRREPA